MAEKPPTKFWELLGKLTAVVTLLGALVGLFQNYTAPRSDLSAEVTWSAITYPDSIAASYRDLRKNLSSQSLQAAGGWTEADLQTADHRHKFGALARYVADHISTGPPFPVNQSRGLWRFVIRNNGTLPVEDVALTVPDGIYVQLKREGAPVVSEKIEGIVNIGKLRALQEFPVDVWSVLPPDESNAQQIKLTYSAGVGRVKWKFSTGYIGHLVDRFLSFPLIWVVLLLVGFALHLRFGHVVIWPRPRTTKESVAPKTESESAMGPTSVESLNGPCQSSANYFAFYESVAERPAERDSWLAGIEGVPVNWIGTFNDVNQTKGSKTITLSLHARGTKTTWSQFFAVVPVELKADVYALKKGDVLAVSGKLEPGSMPYAPTISDATIKRSL